MKKIIICLVAGLLWQCRPDIPEGPISTQYDLSKGIEGSWQLSQMVIRDLTLPVPESRDVTDYYTSMPRPLGITFDTEAQTYMVENPDVPANPFGEGGSYEFNDPAYPSAIIFYTMDQDTVHADLANMVRSTDNKMGYYVRKSACDAPYASFDYTFNRK